MAYQEQRQAGCKINLTLRITGQREDGYHLLDSIFWPLSNPHDTLVFSTNHVCAETDFGADFVVTCSEPGIDTQNNTLTKAYAAFVREGGRLPSDLGCIHVHLHKGIPHGAGLGGGSSNAATVLLWCNEKANTPLSEHALHRAAVSVGADVAFFLQNTPARVQGIGDILEELPKPWPTGYVVLLCPQVYISTPWAYKKIDEEKSASFSKKLLTKSGFDYRTLFTGAGHEIVTRQQGENLACVNDFESVVFKAHPQLAKLKQDLLDAGAYMVTMSGSGSSLVGLVATKEAAEDLAKQFQNAQCKVFIAAL